MLWQSHVIVAGSYAALVRPDLVPVAALGATAPDWLEWVISPFVAVRHRTVTHYVVAWTAAALFFALVIDFRGYGLAFALGGLSHVLLDALTISGVPFGPWSQHRFHLFGGKVKTGSMNEFLVVGVIVLGAAAIYFTKPKSDNEFMPFFFQWGSLYEQGIIDGIEWKANRFKLI